MGISFAQPSVFCTKNHINILSDVIINENPKVFHQLSYQIKRLNISQEKIEAGSLFFESFLFSPFPFSKKEVIDQFKNQYPKKDLLKDALFFLKEFETFKTIKNGKEIVLLKEVTLHVPSNIHTISFKTNQTDPHTIFECKIERNGKSVIMKITNQNKNIHLSTDIKRFLSSDVFYPVFNAILYNCNNRIRLLYRYQK